MESLEARTVLGLAPGVPGLLDRSVLRRLPGVMLALAALLLLAVIVLHRRDRVRDFQLANAQARAVATVQGSIVEEELDVLRGAVRYLALEPTLLDYLSGSVGREQVESEWSRLLLSTVDYDQIRLLGPEGRELVRVNLEDPGPLAVPQAELQQKSARYYFEKAWPLPEGGVYLSPLDLNIEHGEIERPFHPMLRLATPVHDRGGVRRGILVVNYSGRKPLERLHRSASYAPGSTWLVDSEGFYLEGPTSEESWGFHFGREPTFACAYPGAWERMQSADRASFSTAEGVFASVRVLVGEAQQSDLGLRVVCHVPSGVAFAQSKSALRRLLAGALLLFVLGTSAALFTFRARETRALDRARLASSESRLRSLAGRLLEVQEEERRSLARDLHDELGQLATATTIHLERARKASTSEAKDKCVDQALVATGDLIQSVRSIASRLRTSLLDDLGLQEALSLATSELSERLGMEVSCDLDLEESRLSAHEREQLYRIVQEALTNIARHSGAARADVRVCVQDDEARVYVEDEGVGFDTTGDLAGRFGLLGMRERTELLGGDFRIESQEGQGTRMEIRFPLETALTHG